MKLPSSINHYLKGTPSTVPNIVVFFLNGAAEAMPNTADQLPQNLDEIKRLDRASR
jgi:hypothetical protein